MLAFALVLILTGLLLIAFAVEYGATETNGLWMLGAGSFILGFGSRCLAAVVISSHRHPPPP